MFYGARIPNNNNGKWQVFCTKTVKIAAVLHTGCAERKVASILITND